GDRLRLEGTSHERNDAEADQDGTSDNTHARHGVKVTELKTRDYMSHAGARRSGVVLLCIHRDASCDLRCRPFRLSTSQCSPRASRRATVWTPEPQVRLARSPGPASGDAISRTATSGRQWEPATLLSCSTRSAGKPGGSKYSKPRMRRTSTGAGP